MLASMTGFATTHLQNEQQIIHWEVRSLNHRFLELNFKLPEPWRELELDLRAMTSKYLQRGKVDCTLKYENFNASSSQRISLNQALLNQLIHLYQTVHQQTRTHFDLRGLDVMTLLQWPNILQMETTADTTVATMVVQTFQQTLEKLVQHRQQEGQALQQLLEQRFQQLGQHAQAIKKRLPQNLELQRQQILRRCEEIKIQVNPERLEQELVLWANRTDVAEELDRIATHLTTAQETLHKQDIAGRRLEFIVQELHREINTLGAKSLSIESTQQVIEMKVILEQIREQIQNIE